MAVYDIGTELQLKAASEEAALAMKQSMGPLNFLAHNFTPAYAAPYSGIAVPVYDLTAAEFTTNNDWSSGATLSGAVVQLEYHPKAGITLTDVDYGATDVNYLRDGAKAIAETIGEYCQKKFFATLTGGIDTTLSASGGAVSAFTASVFGQKVYKLAQNGITTAGPKINPNGAVVLLNSAAFATLVGSLDAAVYGGPEAIRNGVIPGLMGFKAVVDCPFAGTTEGYIIGRDSVGIASRLNQPVVSGYARTWEQKSSDGISLGFRIYEDLGAGALKFGGDTLFGAKVLNNQQIFKLVFTA